MIYISIKITEIKKGDLILEEEFGSSSISVALENSHFMEQSDDNENPYKDGYHCKAMVIYPESRKGEEFNYYEVKDDSIPDHYKLKLNKVVISEKEIRKGSLK